MATNLSSKTLQTIFKFIDTKEERDYGTLYNCALVNRQWCNNVIPTLWKDPFYGEKSDVVIKILLSFLDNDQLQQLGSIRDGLPLNENKMFDYPSFIQHLNLDFIYESLYDLYSGSIDAANLRNVQLPNNPTLLNDIELTFTVLLKMLARKITDVKIFYINWKLHSCYLDEVSKGDIKNNNLKLLLQPEISDLLKITIELRWWQTRPYKGYFVEFAKICSNLEKLVISLANFSENQIDDAAEFIRSQRNLKVLEIFNCNSGIQKILTFSRDQALSIQAIILYHVDFYGCEPLTSLTKCENLRHLSFRYCTYIQKEMCNPLFSANFPNLKKVEAPFTSCPELEEWARSYF
ncbi:2950_t:CDS:2 [Cetraspora pellucida]|uniref:2950_t:CDS:1 n=1 Tax=Cetraspora pellucida TaxID=1433469 RepID=A0A9N9NML3_9GLOM|nr:2950_t:CDS:2 [Cetraspora pellucida]